MECIPQTSGVPPRLKKLAEDLLGGKNNEAIRIGDTNDTTLGNLRVHSGMLEWYNGTGWIGIGSLAQWKDPVANKAALPLTGNTAGDMRLVQDDGDGKGALYQCIATTGDVDAQWSKASDTDWGVSANISYDNTDSGLTATNVKTAIDEVVSEATMNADTDVSSNGWVLDEDDFASNSATKVPTQQSVKEYIDNQSGGATNKVRLNADDGTQAYYSTITAALSAASSGDEIEVFPGTYNEKNILKDGVNQHYHAGAHVNYTGSDNGAIFDDSSTGTNGAVTCKITGHGEFTRAGSGESNDVMRIYNASNICIEGYKMNGASGQPAIRTNNASAVLRAVFCELTGTELGLQLNAITDCVIYVKKLDTTGRAIQGSASGVATVVADTIEGDDASMVINATYFNLTVKARQILATDGVGIQVGQNGVVKVEAGTEIKAIDTNEHAIEIIHSSADLTIGGGCVLIANGTGDSITNTTGGNVNVDVYGHAVANTVVHADITTRIGTYTVDANVT